MTHMRKTLYLLAAWIVLFSIQATAQDKDEQKDFGIDFKGFVKNDAFYDSRQTATAREGHFLLWPMPQSPDNQGKDINAHPQFNMLALQSRLSGTITGPDFLGASTSGTIEGDFFAQANDNINLFRLRHAFVRLEWQNTELLAGQYWNPMFVTRCYPGTVSFNTGVPMQPFARNPQVRLKQSLGSFDVVAAALAQRDYTSRAEGEASSRFLRNSGRPDLHLQLHYSSKSFLAGAGMSYKTIVPRLATDQGFHTEASVDGLSYMVYARVNTRPLTIKLEAVSGQNLSDVLQVSGFATHSIDPATGRRSLEPLRNTSLWADVHTNGKPFRAGLFAGYTRNHGTQEEIIASENLIFGFGNNIASLYRISPRLTYQSGKVRLALEGEYTSATFGSSYNEHAVPEDTHTAANMRLLFSTYYFF